MTSPTGNGKLLMISDIEGCLEEYTLKIDNEKTTLPQNTSLCRLDTFKGPLLNFLKKTKYDDNTPIDNNEIAFLGDYFDKGPGVVDSIIGIAYLHKEKPDNVHIILGNRDMNKFRIAYELDMKKDERSTKDGWKVWKDLYAMKKTDKEGNVTDISDCFDDDGSVKSGNRLKLFHFITSTSMGGMALPTETQIHSSLSEEESLEWLYAVFTDSDILDGYEPNFDIAFSDKDEYKKLFVYSCRYLYKNATIVKKIDRFKVLLSHAGGFNMSVLQGKSFYEGIIGTLSEVGLSYYDKIETARKGLQTNSESYSDIDSVIAYNQRLYKTFVEKFFPENRVDKTPSEQYFLLQAMGLKPDVRFPNFASFIQSCGGGCGQRIKSSGLQSEDTEFFKKISDAGIMTIAHGHVPNCLRFPLIYKRVIGNKTLVFIENDTSNGNRPKLESGKIDELPLSYISITQGSFLYGVGSLNDIGDLIKIKEPYNNSQKKPYTTKNRTTIQKLSLIDGDRKVDYLLTNEEIDKILEPSEIWGGPTDIKGGKRLTKKNKSKTKKRKNIKKRSCRNKCKFH